MKRFSDVAKGAGRLLGAGVCAALVLALVCLSLAVLVQALALFVLAALAGAFFLPRPLSWYAEQAAQALRVFAGRLFAPPVEEKRREGGEGGRPDAESPTEAASRKAP